MASRARRPEFRLMNIRVTRCTALACPAEFQVCVAARARNTFVLTREEETGLVVVELCIRTHGPRIRGMAFLTGNFHVAVRRMLCAADCHQREKRGNENSDPCRHFDFT